MAVAAVVRPRLDALCGKDLASWRTPMGVLGDGRNGRWAIPAAQVGSKLCEDRLLVAEYVILIGNVAVKAANVLQLTASMLVRCRRKRVGVGLYLPIDGMRVEEKRGTPVVAGKQPYQKDT